MNFDIVILIIIRKEMDGMNWRRDSIIFLLKYSQEPRVRILKTIKLSTTLMEAHT